MERYKTSKEDLQEFMQLVFGKGSNMSDKAEKMRSGIYKAGGMLGISVIFLAVLLLNFTG